MNKIQTQNSVVFTGTEESALKLKKFLELNKNKYMVHTDFTEHYKYIFDYSGDIDIEDLSDVSIYYKIMRPLHSSDKSILYKNSHLNLFDNDIIRFATDEEIQSLISVIERREENKKKMFKKNYDLIKKYNAESELDLKTILIKKIMDSDNIVETLKEILSE